MKDLTPNVLPRQTFTSLLAPPSAERPMSAAQSRPLPATIRPDPAPAAVRDEATDLAMLNLHARTLGPILAATAPMLLQTSEGNR